MTNITEQRNDRFGDMDALSTEELMYRINDEDAKVAAAVRLTIPQAAAAAEHAAAESPRAEGLYTSAREHREGLACWTRANARPRSA